MRTAVDVELAALARLEGEAHAAQVACVEVDHAPAGVCRVAGERQWYAAVTHGIDEEGERGACVCMHRRHAKEGVVPFRGEI